MELKTPSLGFAALAQETRLNLMRLLASCASVRPLGRRVGRRNFVRLPVDPVLSSLGFGAGRALQSTRRGRYVVYTVRFSGLRALFSLLTETCCSGRPELCGDLLRLLPDPTGDDEPMSSAFNVLFLCTHILPAR